jgi:2-polyprenyl-3-methyl-5-hydroxy-6-metoxy-1,4-benzoquinol methylase
MEWYILPTTNEKSCYLNNNQVSISLFGIFLRVKSGCIRFCILEATMSKQIIRQAHQESQAAWEANAATWDARMGDQGNDFVNLLCWPAIERLLEVKPGQTVLDIACGNGLLSRRLAALGAQVTAFDFSPKLIKAAKQRSRQGSLITYHVLDATDEQALLAFGTGHFDSAMSNMALFDMAEIEPLFHATSKLLKPGGTFVFTLMHPAFNNPSSTLMAEEWDNGELHTRFAVKTHRYQTAFQARGLALRNQPKPQWYFHRPLQEYLNLGFRYGFVLDGFEELAFPADTPQSSLLGWGGKFSEIPPVLAARLRLAA